MILIKNGEDLYLDLPHFNIRCYLRSTVALALCPDLS